MRDFVGFKKGVNLGGWLSQCDYSLDRLENFIKEEDIARIASWGADHVRLPFDFNIVLDENGDLKPDAFKYLDRAVEWSQKHGLNIILDLHKTMGYSFDPGEKEVGFFSNVKYQDIFVNLWKAVAARYADKPDSIAYEILNEITDDEFAQPWNKIARRAVEEIRKIAPKNYIIYGGIHNNSIKGLPLLEKPHDDRIVFTFHFYDPIIFTHQKAYWVLGMPADYEMSYPAPTAEFVEKSNKFPEKKIPEVFEGYTEDVVDARFFEFYMKEAVEFAEKMNTPLYCGEYGVIEVAPHEDTLRWHRDMRDTFDKLNIARAIWSYKEMDYGIIDDIRKPICDELIKLI